MINARLGRITSASLLQILFLLIAAVATPAFAFFAPLSQAPQASQDPPREAGTFREPDLVDLASLDPTIHLEIRYATSNNFMGRPVYEQARAFLQKPAAMALLRAHKNLYKKGYGLLVFDGYRPWSVTKLFWDSTPDEKRIFVADPSKGSRHNRGCAVDLSLYDLKTGKEIEMPGAYDEMTERSYASYAGGTVEQRRTRDLLRKAMEDEGYSVYPEEWWHYDYKDWQKYPILNIKFADLKLKKQQHAGR